MLSLTQKALEEFDNQHDFERMCTDILNALGYKDVTPTAPRGGGDGGKDITFTTESGGKGLACVTLRQDSEKKFEEDFSQRKAGEYEKYYFFTNRYLTSTQKIKLAKFSIENLNAELITQDREAIRSLLDSVLQTIRKRYLYIDDDNSAKARKHITKMLKYPATLSSTNFQDKAGFAEWILTTPMHREIYYYISEIDDEELKQIPLIGNTLHSFKEHYYNLHLLLDSLTQKCRKLIHTQTTTSFQFMHGWTIYFKYFLLRCFGNSEEEVQQLVATNYDITHQECERVFNLLKTTNDIASEIDSTKTQWEEINKIITELTVEINKLNSRIQ